MVYVLLCRTIVELQPGTAVHFVVNYYWIPVHFE